MSSLLMVLIFVDDFRELGHGKILIHLGICNDDNHVSCFADLEIYTTGNEMNVL